MPWSRTGRFCSTMNVKALNGKRLNHSDGLPGTILSSDSHLFEPPDLWQTRIDAAFRDRAPPIERIDGADQIVVEADQILSGIGLISNADARFEAPRPSPPRGALRRAPRRVRPRATP